MCAQGEWAAVHTINLIEQIGGGRYGDCCSVSTARVSIKIIFQFGNGAAAVNIKRNIRGNAPVARWVLGAHAHHVHAHRKGR